MSRGRGSMWAGERRSTQGSTRAGEGRSTLCYIRHGAQLAPAGAWVLASSGAGGAACWILTVEGWWADEEAWKSIQYCCDGLVQEPDLSRWALDKIYQEQEGDGAT